MGFTFDAPTYAPSHTIGKRQPAKPKIAGLAYSSSFLDKFSHRVRNPFHRSNSSASKILTPIPSTPIPQLSKSVPAAESFFFRLPLELREAIYGLIVARRNTIHILIKRRPKGISRPLVHRICQAEGNLNECVLYDCKRFLAIEEGQACYFGSFATVSGLLYTCRDM